MMFNRLVNVVIFFFKQKTAYEMRISDWSSDVCSSDLRRWDRDNRRDSRNWNRNDSRRWSRDWRHDRRYDWRDYRQAHRSHYRQPRYYSPYRNHRYTRFSIGFTLGSLFYGERYWIHDPWYYRLPPAYGHYRGVRY